MEDATKRKVHRPKQAGAKFDKRKEADRAKRHPNDKGNKDPRAFGVSKIGRARKAVQRKVDISHRKAHAPLVDRRPEVEAPPVVVVVMGPPKSGKSTLIKVSADGSALGVALVEGACSETPFHAAAAVSREEIHQALPE